MNDNLLTEPSNTQSEQSRLVVRWLIREVIGVLMVAAILFIAAGRLDWLMGWAMVAVYAVWVAANAIILIPRYPELLAERATRRLEGVKSWDNIILGIIGVATIAKYILAGLDMRNGWTNSISPGLQITALAVAALGYALVTWAMTTNAFFSLVVRIQEERSHQVATGGPYRFVRHPGYMGSVLFELATPILLGSWWALIPGGLIALLTILRTALEDRTLKNELDGYQEYARRVRHRLVPGVW